LEASALEIQLGFGTFGDNGSWKVAFGGGAGMVQEVSFMGRCQSFNVGVRYSSGD
jgi:hypothetical protein